MSSGIPVKRASFARPTIARWLWLAFGLLILVLIGTFIVYYWHNQRLDNHVEVLNVQELREQTALDMRFNAASINRSLSDYMRDRDPTKIENARDFETGFETSAGKLSQFAQTDEAKHLSQELDTLYEEYKSAANDTIDLTDQHYAAFLSFQENIEDISLSIYEIHQATIDEVPAEALEKLDAVMNMRSSLDEISIAVEAYTSEPDPTLRQEVLDEQEEFEHHVDLYEETSLASYESSWLNLIHALFEDLTADSDNVLALTNSLYEVLTQFEQSYQALDTYFSEQVLPSVNAEVLAAQEEQDSLSSSADRWLIALIITGVLIGILASFFISRKITIPIRDLIKGAKIVESGRIDYRYNIDAKGEFGQLAVSLNRMLNNLDRIHKALEQSEEQAWALLDVTNDTVILIDIRGAILASNEIAAEKFGISLEQMINESLYDLLPAESTASLKAHIDEAIHLRRPVHYEDEQEGKVIDQNILPMLDPKGDITRIAIFSRDVTVHKWVDDVTTQYGRRHELILQAAGEGVFGLDTQGITTFVNPVAARMLGYEPEELIGKRHHDLVHYSRPDGKPYPSEQCPIYAAFKDGTIHTNVDDEVFWRKNGTSFPVEYTSTPIIENDMILGAVITFRDITDRK